MSHQVDIIIRAKDGHELTHSLITSIAANTKPEMFNIILVDDGSAPPYDHIEDVTHVRHATARGAVSATNSGIAIALLTDAPFVIIMDNDTEIPDGDVNWLERFIQDLKDAGGSTACVGATSNFVNPPQHILTVPQTYTADVKDVGVKDNPAVPWFVSFCVLFDKNVLRQAPLWDEQYNPGNYEDTDYAMQLRSQGMEIRVAQSVYIHHKGHSTFGDDMKQLLAVNKDKFYRKWGVGRLLDLGFIQPSELQKASDNA
jgi:GT2 family glycosyltransferase